MNTSLADQYFLKALDLYGWNDEMMMESLNYALSYDDEHAQSLCLAGRVMMEKLKDFREAQVYFEKALLYNPEYVDTYKYYSLLLIWLGDFQKSFDILRRAENVKGMPKIMLFQRMASIYECIGKIDRAIKEVQKGKLFSGCQRFYKYFEEEESRLKKKVKCHRKKKRLKKKKK